MNHAQPTATPRHETPTGPTLDAFWRFAFLALGATAVGVWVTAGALVGLALVSK
jgi:hypothetical protein